MRRLVIFGIALLLHGCIALPDSYFSPHASTGELKRNLCHGSVAVGPLEAIEIDALGVPITIELSQRGEEIAYFFSFSVPESKTISWVSPDVNISVNSQPEVTVTINSFNEYDYNTQKTSGVKIGEAMIAKAITLRNGRRSVTNSYYGSYKLKRGSAIEIDQVNISPIELVVDGKKTGIPSIEFKSDFGIFIYPFNC